jgi:hypothetical protein
MLCGPLFVVAYGHSSRVPTGRVIFEIGGAPVREELARDGTVMLLLGHLSTYLSFSASPSWQQAPNGHGVH